MAVGGSSGSLAEKRPRSRLFRAAAHVDILRPDADVLLRSACSKPKTVVPGETRVRSDDGDFGMPSRDQMLGGKVCAAEIVNHDAVRPVTIARAVDEHDGL